MKEIADKIWAKHINDWLEKSMGAHKYWAEKIAEEEAEKLSQQIAECREEIEKLTTAEMADIIVTATNRNNKLEQKNKELQEELKTLEQIKNIIIDKYNLYEDY
jgi:hypothetical protein